MGCSSSKHENDRGSAGFNAGRSRLGDDAVEEAASVITGPGLTSRVHLSLSCQGLLNIDKGSLSDPFVVVSMKSGGETAWSELARTEVVANNLSPNFVALVPVTFRFEEVQMLRFHVYHVAGSFTTSDATGLALSSQVSQGSAECALASIMGAHGQTLTQPLHCPNLPNQNGSITVRAEQAKKSSDLVAFELAGSNLPSGCKRLFIRFSRTMEQGTPLPCFKTEVADVSARSCRWRESKVSLPVLANGDTFRPLVVECFAYQKSGAHKLMGSCTLRVDDMLNKSGSEKKFILSDGSGELSVLSCKLIPQPSFFDYLAGGLQMQFTVAIDYTSSNGDPNVASSLHYHDPSGRSMNQYAQAISSVGSILEFYDADKRFPVMGFGGCTQRGQPTQHKFAVNGNEQDPEVQGIDGVLDVYRQSLQWIELSGPTLFAPVISQAANLAALRRTSDPTEQTYSVLLLLTDGVIHDMDSTKDELVAAADQPFSVIIVGVGEQEDFGPMEELDGDQVRITDSSGKPASRDIVQFVPMQDFKEKGFHALAREVLAEIPAQVLEYMQNNRIAPCAPKQQINS